MVLHMRFKSLNISYLSSAKQQLKITNVWVLWKMCTAMTNFFVSSLELNALISH